MKSVHVVVMLFVLACGSLAPNACAQSDRAYTPFMLSLVSPLQVPFRDFDVGGMRVSAIYGECHDFDGLDISVFGRATGHANGLQLGVGTIVDGDGIGLQAGGVAFVKGEYTGFQIGGVNFAQKARALQIGLLYNGAEHIEGCQIGLINVTRTMIGFQLGLINVIQDNDVPFMPVFNCYF